MMNHEAAVDIIARRILANGAREHTLDRRADLMEAFGVDNPTYDEVERRVGQILGSIDPLPESVTDALHYLASKEGAER